VIATNSNSSGNVCNTAHIIVKLDCVIMVVSDSSDVLSVAIESIEK